MTTKSCRQLLFVVVTGWDGRATIRWTGIALYMTMTTYVMKYECGIEGEEHLLF